jgi:uracil-DNA glycosylase family 4
MDLKMLQARIRACRLCLDAGYEIIPKPILSGHAKAKVMIIGQAPGITEVEAGRPFNAASGRRLFSWLDSAGIEESEFRSKQYLTSVTKCYPGKSKNGHGDRVPTRREQALCRPFLEQEISIVNPTLIIAIGRLAIDLFYDSDDALSEIIGTEKRQADHWIVPLPHPSGASRWLQIQDHRQRIDRAVLLIRRHWLEIEPKMQAR